MSTNQVVITSSEKTNNKFTTSHARTINNNNNNVLARKLLPFRADLCAEQQEAVVAKTHQIHHDRWVHAHEETTTSLLSAQDSAWCGKALLSEAIRFQYSHKSKRLTKTLLERSCPLMQREQSRYEEDIAFSLEEKQRLILIEQHLQRLPNVGTMSEAELEDARDKLDRQIDAPEIEARDIVAPMAPELAQAMWHDFDLLLGVAPVQQQQPQQLAGKAQEGAGGVHRSSSPVFNSPKEIKAKYAQAMGSFTQLQLWRVKRSKCKYQ